MKNLFNFSLILFLTLSLNSFSQGLNSISSPNGSFVIAAGSGGKIIYSTNSGGRWFSSTIGAANFKSVFSLGSTVWISSGSGNVYISSISNLNLVPQSTGNSGDINSVYFVNTNTGFACSADGKIYKSINGGVNWIQQYSGGQNLNSISFKDDMNGVCSGSAGTLLETSNSGANWQVVSSGSTKNLLKVKYFSQGYVAVGEYGTLISKSSPLASVNMKINSDIRGVSGTSINDVHVCGGGGFIRNNKNNNALYTNFETNPELQNLVDIFYYDASNGWAVSSINDCVIRTTNGGENWENTGNVSVNFLWENKLDFLPTSSYAANIYQHPTVRTTFFAPFSNKIYVTRNNGDNWSVVSTYTPNIPVNSGTYSHNFYVSKLDTNVWIAALRSYPRNSIVRTTNYGVTWNTVKDSMVFGPFSNPLDEDGTYPGVYYCANDSGGFYKSTDNGASFIKISNHPYNIPCDVLSLPDTNIILIGNANYTLNDSASLLRSTNGGVNWTTVRKFSNVQEIPYMAVSQFDNRLVYSAVLGQKIQKSTDYGATWERVESSILDPWALCVCNEDPTFISYARYDMRSYFSTNSGASFTSVSFPGTNYSMNSIITPERGITFGYMNRSVYKLKITYNVVIDVKNITTVVPDKFSLSQNFPNPFNPNTNIRFQLSKSSFVSLKIFDAVGREISELVNQNLNTGEYEVNFNGNDLNSGIYFYKLETGSFTETKKMILVK